MAYVIIRRDGSMRNCGARDNINCLTFWARSERKERYNSESWLMVPDTNRTPGMTSTCLKPQNTSKSPIFFRIRSEPCAISWRYFIFWYTTCYEHITQGRASLVTHPFFFFSNQPRKQNACLKNKALWGFMWCKLKARENSECFASGERAVINTIR